MRNFALLLAGLRLAAAIALPVQDNIDTADASSKDNPEANSKVPDGVFLEPWLKDQTTLKDGATIKKLKYGPYRVGAMGSLENRMSFGLAKPCSGGCYIVGIQADLVYAKDGKVGEFFSTSRFHSFLDWSGTRASHTGETGVWLTVC
jgi:hypothetical protein